MIRLAQGRSAGAPAIRDAARAPGADTLAARYEFTPNGPILIEIFPKHDDFAVRTLGLPGMIGALGVCFGRVVTMDSPRARPPGEFQWEATLWHELGARHHAADVEPAAAAVAHRRDLGLRGEEGAARVGPRMDVEFAGMLNRGETIKLRDLNAAFTEPEDDLARLLSRHRCWSSTSSTPTATPALRKLVRAYAQGIDTDAALKAALGTDFDQLQAGFDQTIERMFGDDAAGDGAARRRRGAAEDAGAALKTIAAPTRAAIRCRWRWAGAAQSRPDRRGDAGVRARRGAGADRRRRRAVRTSSSRRWRWRKRIAPRAITELTALVAVDFNNVEAARQLADLLRQKRRRGAPSG